jgi:hypothetical protein
MLRRMRMVGACVFLIACGKSDPQWLKDLKPKMQTALDGQKAVAAKVLSVVDGAKADVPCKAVTGVVPTLSRELLDELTRGTHAPLEISKVGAYPFLAGDPYQTLLGGKGTISPGSLEGAIADLANAQAIGVFVTDTVDFGKIDGNAIVRPGTFSGRFVLVSLPALTVIGSAPITAKTNDWMTARGSLEQELRNNLGSNVLHGAEAACPGLVTDGKHY